MEAQTTGRTTVDGVSESPYPSTNKWLNSMIATAWLNYRDLASHILLEEVWPKLRKQIQQHTAKTGVALKLTQLDIGDGCPIGPGSTMSREVLLVPGAKGLIRSGVSR